MAWMSVLGRLGQKVKHLPVKVIEACEMTAVLATSLVTHLCSTIVFFTYDTRCYPSTC